MTLRKANEHRNAWFEGVQRCCLDESLFTIMERIVRAEVHRLVVVDEQEKVIGIISLSDILLYLVLRPSGEGVGGTDLSVRETVPRPMPAGADTSGADAATEAVVASTSLVGNSIDEESEPSDQAADAAVSAELPIVNATDADGETPEAADVANDLSTLVIREEEDESEPQKSTIVESISDSVSTAVEE